MNAYAVSYKSAKEAIDDANDFIFQKMGYENYYLFKIGNMDINEKLAQYGSEHSTTGRYLYMGTVWKLVKGRQQEAGI